MNRLHGIIFAYDQRTELRELTERRTGASMPFGGRYRAVDFALSNLLNAGVTDVGLVLHGRYQSMLDHVGSGKVWDMSRKRGGLHLLPPFNYLHDWGVTPFRGKMEALAGVRDYLDDAGADALLLTAVEWHSAFRLPEALDDRTRLFCQILRDADKIDILRVNVETPMEEIYNVSTAALRRSPVTPAVLDAFYAHHCVLHSLKQYPADNAVGHASLVFELCYPESLRIVDEQGWLWRLLDFKTDNPDTASAFAAIRDELHRWLNAQSA